jgi:hypothetical protein
MFVHRNVANLTKPDDPNFLAALQFAVDVLKVEHVIVVGHYGCGGVHAAMNGGVPGAISRWLEPLGALHARLQAELGGQSLMPDELCRRNVSAQVDLLAENPMIRKAWASGTKINLHGWVYSIADGLLEVVEAPRRTLRGTWGEQGLPKRIGLMAERLPQLDPDRREVALMSRAIKACMLATAASRGLDATICAAAFPSLAEMEELEPGIWRGSNGERVRALRYSRIWKAAATLVPAGCWIEHDCDDVVVCGPDGEARGTHDIFPIALCLAAMRARVIAHEPRAPHQDLPQEQFNV